MAGRTYPAVVRGGGGGTGAARLGRPSPLHGFELGGTVVLDDKPFACLSNEEGELADRRFAKRVAEFRGGGRSGVHVWCRIGDEPLRIFRSLDEVAAASAAVSDGLARRRLVEEDVDCPYDAARAGNPCSSNACLFSDEEDCECAGAAARAAIGARSSLPACPRRVAPRVRSPMRGG